MKHTDHIISAILNTIQMSCSFILAASPAIFAATLASCSTDDRPTAASGAEGQELYIVADLNTGEVSRIAYDYPGSVLQQSAGNICATWEAGDVIKVYETDLYAADDPEPPYTDVYHDYEDYNAQHPFPTAPTDDHYYRFECVGGYGTSRGLFKYMGLASAKVQHDNVTGAYNVDLDINYNHKIRNWNRFQGLVIFGNPLRQHMMRTQAANNDLTHLKYGQRMFGHLCAHNFQWWFDKKSQSTNGVGADGLILRNIGGCVYQIILGGLDTPIYGGSTLSLSMPLATSVSLPLYNEPMTLTLGSSEDYTFGKAPWCEPDPELAHTQDLSHTIIAYIVGWPGELAAGQTAVVQLTEHTTGKVFTWNLTAPRDISFEQGFYYTFDLRDNPWTSN